MTMQRMLRPTLCAVLLACAAAAQATGVDVNTATEAELDGVRGIGPGLSGRILQQRSQAPFRDWQDFIARVGGVGRASAARLSAQGLTVQGRPYEGTQAPAAAPAEPAAATK